MSAGVPRSGAPIILGVDVGGTNTDAVLMQGREVIASVKRATTFDVGEGMFAAVDKAVDTDPQH